MLRLLTNAVRSASLSNGKTGGKHRGICLAGGRNKVCVEGYGLDFHPLATRRPACKQASRLSADDVLQYFIVHAQIGNTFRSFGILVHELLQAPYSG